MNMSRREQRLCCLTFVFSIFVKISIMEKIISFETIASPGCRVLIFIVCISWIFSVGHWCTCLCWPVDSSPCGNQFQGLVFKSCFALWFPIWFNCGLVCQRWENRKQFIPTSSLLKAHQSLGMSFYQRPWLLAGKEKTSVQVTSFFVSFSDCSNSCIWSIRVKLKALSKFEVNPWYFPLTLATSS